VPPNAPPLSHRVIAANVHAVPAPYRSFAVRSDEPQHACDARAPYGWVHLVRTTFLDAASLARLAAAGEARCSIEASLDIDYATTTLPELAAAVPHVSDLTGYIAGALQLTGVLGGDLADYRSSVATLKFAQGSFILDVTLDTIDQRDAFRRILADRDTSAARWRCSTTGLPTATRPSTSSSARCCARSMRTTAPPNTGPG
jgi:hypothetical protein